MMMPMVSLPYPPQGHQWRVSLTGDILTIELMDAQYRDTGVSVYAIVSCGWDVFYSPRYLTRDLTKSVVLSHLKEVVPEGVNYQARKDYYDMAACMAAMAEDLSFQLEDRSSLLALG